MAKRTRRTAASLHRRRRINQTRRDVGGELKRYLQDVDSETDLLISETGELRKARSGVNVPRYLDARQHLNNWVDLRTKFVDFGRKRIVGVTATV